LNLNWIMPAKGSGSVSRTSRQEYGFLFYMDIIITINGKSQNIKEGNTLMSLLKFLDINPGRVAVEYNKEIIDKGQYDSVRLKENDNLEIITFVGGGNV